jgi:hypothetical protein
MLVIRGGIFDMYTKILKPTGTTYTPVNSAGKIQYDQASLTYDDSSTFYDGYNPNQYTKISKPQGYGQMTWDDMNFAWYLAGWQWGSSTNNYTKVAKPV